MQETETDSKKTFTIHRLVGRYEIFGSVTFIPAPPSGILSSLAEAAVEECIADLVRDQMLRDLAHFN